MKIDINKYKNNENEKVKITFSVSNEVIQEFKKLTKELKLNQSLLVEDMIKEINKQLIKIKEKENKQNNTNNNTTTIKK